MQIGTRRTFSVHRYIGGGIESGWMVWIYCPGCEAAHALQVPRWSFNGSYDAPTFTPSLLTRGEKLCHLFITDGRLRFLGDCEHDLANQVVDLPDLPEWLQ